MSDEFITVSTLLEIQLMTYIGLLTFALIISFQPFLRFNTQTAQTANSSPELRFNPS